MISIIDIDSKIPNLALKKIEKFYLDKGEQVEWNNELMASVSDKVYVSCVFTKNKDKCLEWQGKAEIGGTGYDLTIKLPPEIEAVKPRINLGFATRGCIRKCEFCVVPKKEGKIRVEGDIYDIWDGNSREIILLDNNILALPDHFKLICSQIRKEKLKVDFNQGLDHRLLTDEICEELKKTRTADLRFAFDDPSYKPTVEKALNMLARHNIKKTMWYVLVGFNTTVEQDLERLNWLFSRDERPYVMRYEKCKGQIYIQMARWVNSPLWRNAMSFDDFLERQGIPI